ncbi:MAG TPA: PQQ-binding-like beta-propeller repeat protein [Caulobacteraceae bacterium]|jgi:outer membrane protein assembly factor BamB
MTTRRAVSVLAAIVAASLAVSACHTFPRPFAGGGGAPHKRGPDESNRISLLELNDQLRVSDSLRGQDFFLPAPQPQASWPLPGGTPEQSVENVDAAPSFQIAWRRPIGERSARHSDVEAPPVMADGKVFVMDAMADVSAHDAQTGAQLWRVDLRPKDKHGRGRNGFGGGIAFDNGKLYVTSGFRLVAELDANTGHLDWMTPTDAPLHAAPTVANGRVYVVDVDDELLTFVETTGVQDWTYQGLTEPARILMASSPAVSNDTLVASFASGEVVALKTDNGTELWDQPLSRTTRTNALSEIRDIAGRPVIYKGDVFAISHAAEMAAIDLRTGTPRWSIPVSGITTPWPTGDVVYAIDQSGNVICASRETGQLYWMTNLNTPPAPVEKGKKPPKTVNAVWSSPIVADSRIIAVSDTGEAVAINAKTGQVQSRLKLGDDALIGPIAAGGMIYVVTEAAELIALR